MPPQTVPLPKYGKEPRPAVAAGPPDEDPRHRYLADYVRQLLQISESFMANRWPAWQDTDKRLRCFVDVTEVDPFTTRQKRPHDVKLVLPASYTIHESILACMAFRGSLVAWLSAAAISKLASGPFNSQMGWSTRLH